jgi:hypothetical protein
VKFRESGRVVRVVLLGALVLTVGAGFGRYTGAVQAQRSQDPARQRVQDPNAVTVKDQTKTSVTQPGSIPIGGTPDTMDDMNRTAADEVRLKAMSDERQKKLQDDVNKLLALSTELKSAVDKTNKDQLSLDAIRKAAEIEKLAHSIQSRMKS